MFRNTKFCFTITEITCLWLTLRKVISMRSQALSGFVNSLLLLSCHTLTTHLYFSQLAHHNYMVPACETWILCIWKESYWKYDNYPLTSCVMSNDKLIECVQCTEIFMEQIRGNDNLKYYYYWSLNWLFYFFYRYVNRFVSILNVWYPHYNDCFLSLRLLKIRTKDHSNT